MNFGTDQTIVNFSILINLLWNSISTSNWKRPWRWPFNPDITAPRYKCLSSCENPPDRPFQLTSNISTQDTHVYIYSFTHFIYERLASHIKDRKTIGSCKCMSSIPSTKEPHWPFLLYAEISQAWNIQGLLFEQLIYFSLCDQWQLNIQLLDGQLFFYLSTLITHVSDSLGRTSLNYFNWAHEKIDSANVYIVYYLPIIR